MRLQSVGCELRDQVAIGSMSIGHCKEISIAILVMFDKILILIWLMGIVRIVALSGPMAPSQHLLKLVDGLCQRRTLALVEDCQRCVLCLCSQPQVLEDLLVVGGETVVGLEICGLSLSFMLSEDSIVTIRQGLELDLSRQFVVTRVQLCRFPQRKFLEFASRWFRSQLLNFNRPIQRKNRPSLINRPQRILFEAISLVLLYDAVQLKLTSRVDKVQFLFVFDQVLIAIWRAVHRRMRDVIIFLVQFYDSQAVWLLKGYRY